MPHVSGGALAHACVVVRAAVADIVLCRSRAALLSGLSRGCIDAAVSFLSSSSRARFHLIVILVSPWHNMSEIAGLTANDFLAVAIAV